jgi:hypothetical protein
MVCQEKNVLDIKIFMYNVHNRSKHPAVSPTWGPVPYHRPLFPIWRKTVIDKILPKYQVHIINGPTGSAKTRWFHWWAKDWKEGKPVLGGYTSNPVPLIYIARDRPLDSVQETLKCINCLGLFDTVSVFYEKNLKLEQLLDRYSKYKAFFIDPIAKYVPGCRINDYGAVSDFLTDTAEICQKNKITILGSCHGPKAKEGQRYLNPREMTMGSGAWGGYCETMFSLNSDDFAVENPLRYFWVLARNQPDRKYYFRMPGGMIELVEDPLIQDTYSEFIAAIPADIPISRSELVTIAHRIGANCQNFDRDYLKRAEKDGYLQIVRHGYYKRPSPS